MKYATRITLLFAFFLSACSASQTAEQVPSTARYETPDTQLTNETGTIRQVTGAAFGIEPDGNTALRYAPSNLPNSLHIDGLRVQFAGTVGEIPPNVRMWGIPFEITSIERLASE